MVASGSRTMIVGSLSSLYEGLACQEVFSQSTFLLFLRFERARERSSALMARQALCLAALSGHPPEPGGSRRKARGVDSESACRATMVSGHYAAICFCDTRRINLYPVGASPVPRSLLQQCEGTGLQGKRSTEALPIVCAGTLEHR
jgi:hypothetical protein